MQKMKLVMLVAVSFAFSLFAQNTWFVDVNSPQDGPGDTPETAWRIIQDAMDNPSLGDGDTILVAPGVYDQGGFRVNQFEAITRVYFRRNNLTVQAISDDPADTTIVGAPDPDSESGFGTNAVRGVYIRAGGHLIGFTVTGGHTATGNQGYGGGIILWGTNSVVSNCVVVGNRASNRGGGIAPATRDRDGGRVYNSVIRANFVPGNYGGGIGQRGDGARNIVINSIIEFNTNHCFASVENGHLTFSS